MKCFGVGVMRKAGASPVRRLPKQKTIRDEDVDREQGSFAVLDLQFELWEVRLTVDG